MRYEIDEHAYVRLADRGVTEAELEAVLTDPDDIVADPSSGRDGYMKFINGRLITAMVETWMQPPLVVTITVN
jgi:hypothetical protein